MKTIQTNALEVDQIWALYQRYHFLYPQKLEKLVPLLPLIHENLIKAFQLPDHLYRLLTHYNESQGEFSSIAAWRYTPSAMIIQHLVSTHPLKTREIFLYHILKLAGLSSEAKTDYILSYYQAKTKFVHRMFTALHQGQEPDSMLLQPFHYYEGPLSALAWPEDEEIAVSKLQESDDQAFQSLVVQERGELYWQAMALEWSSHTLQTVNLDFQQAGLYRQRTIWIARDQTSQQVCAALILNEGSVGLHFSLIENSGELILDDTKPLPQLKRAAQQLLSHASQYLQEQDRGVGYLPLLVKATQADQVEWMPLHLQREYYLMVCHRTNFLHWIGYLFQEYEKSLHYQPSPQNLTMFR